MSRVWQKWTLAFAIGYFVFFWLNLHHLPIPWIDEVGYLDPAWNAWKSGTFASNLWPHEGADSQFMAHLPALQWVHYLTFTVLPHTVWFTRLPLSLILLLGALTWVKWLKTKGLHWFAVFLWLTVFLCDRSVFEAARSMRMEVIEVLLVGLAFLLLDKQRYSGLGVTLGLLVLTHPKVWVIAAVLGGFALLKGSGSNRWRCLAGAFLPIIAYLIQIEGDVIGWYHQLVSHGTDHTIGGIPGNQFWHHFIGRYQLYQPVSQTFTCYYHWQWYVPVIQWVALFIACKRIVQFWKKRRFEPTVPLLSIVFVINQVYWFAVVGPFQKYNAVILAMGYALFLLEVCRLPLWGRINKSWRYGYFIIIPFVLAPVAMRHAGAIVQWEARDVDRFNDWLFEEIDAESKTLIVECASAWYETRHRENVDFQFQFFLFNNHFDDYDQVYYVTHKVLPFKLKSTYEPPSAMKRYTPENLRGITHDELHVYALTKSEYNSLIDDFRRK